MEAQRLCRRRDRDWRIFDDVMKNCSHSFGLALHGEHDSKRMKDVRLSEQALTKLRAAQQLDDLAVQTLHDLPRRCRGRQHAEPGPRRVAGNRSFTHRR